VSNLGDFRNLVRTQCRALHLCRQIATASKHRVVTKYPDPAVMANLKVQPQTQGKHAAWAAVVSDGQQTHEAIDVLEEARLYWYRFIDDLGMID
jgi:hypothetical protein